MKLIMSRYMYRYKLVLCPSNSGAIDEFGGDWGVKTTLAAPAAEHK